MANVTGFGHTVHALVLLFFAACAPVGGGYAYVAPRWQDMHWREVRTARFIVRSDLPTEYAKEWARKLEKEVVEPSELPWLRELPPNEAPQTVVVVLAREADFSALTRLHTCIPTLRGSQGRRLPVVVAAASCAENLVSFVTEVRAERLLANTTPPLPYWAKRAWPKYLSSAKLEGTSLVLGTTPLFSVKPATVPSVAALLAIKDEFELETQTNVEAFTYAAWHLLNATLDDESPHAWRDVQCTHTVLEEQYRRLAASDRGVVRRIEAPIRTSSLLVLAVKFTSAEELFSSGQAAPAETMTIEKLARREGRTTPQIAPELLPGLRGRKGVILVKVRVRASGDVAGAFIVRSTMPELDKTVLKLVSSWRFVPPGQNVEFLQPFSFLF